MATTIAVRTKKERKGKADVVGFSEAAVRQNMAILDYCRTSMVALSGCTAGILGLTGLYGFVFYFVMTIFLSVLLLVKSGSKSHLYFRSKMSVVTGGIMGGLFTYVLFWTFLYGMVHVY